MANLKSGTRPPWVGLAASIWLQVGSGTPSTFPLYSNSLKSTLGFDQRLITLLGVANDIGDNVALLPGFACNRFPPWVVLLIGAFCCFFGYSVLWLALTRTLTSLPYWMLWLASVIATNSGAWFSMAVVVVNMRNFPLSRGTVAGILKGYAGLSAAVYTQLYSVLLHNSSTNLLLFLALGIPGLSLLMIFSVKACTPADDYSSENCHFLFIQAASVLLGLHIIVTSALDEILVISTPVAYSFLLVMVLLLMAPLAVPVKMTFCPSRRVKSSTDQTVPLLETSASPSQSFNEDDGVSEIDMLLAEGEGAVKKKRRPRRGEDFTFGEALIKADFWLLFLVSFVGVGTGVTVLNNLAQIGIAQHMQDTKLLLSLFSFCNFLGRLGGGAVSEYFVRSKTIPRTVWLAITQAIMVGTHLLFASDVKGSLLVGTLLLGVCFGCQFTIMIPTVSEIFGLKNFGLIASFLSLSSPLGSFLFSSVLAATVYDNEAAKQQSNTCLGPDCFRITFLVLAGVCAIGAVLNVVLSVRVRPVYKMLYAGGSFRMPTTEQK